MPEIIFIVGPTGVGKSEAGFLLAQKLDGEIVSCDALQIYRELNIVCDKPSKEMRSKIPHHLIDVVSVTEEFDAARFRVMATDAIEDIIKRKKTPIVVGGSGMYMSVLLDGIFEASAKDEALRKELQERLDREGAAVLHGQLMRLDAKAAAKIHPNDPQRILRALEVVMTTGVPISDLQSKREGLWGKYPIKIYGLNRDRAELYTRAEQRIDRMFEQGLVQEIENLSNLHLSRTAAASIGVPEVKGYLKGEHDLERAKYLMKLNTRHYVKRQLTWFRRDQRVKWIEVEGLSGQDILKRLI
jgi:tRNA dimethylallyltransferase